METKVTINEIEYIIVKEVTPESALAEGHTHLAAYMKAKGVTAEVYLKRPAGKKLFVNFRDEYGRLGSPVELHR